MDNNRDKRIAAAFERLFRTYQQSDRGDAESVIRERMERAQVYLDAVELYEVEDVEAAVESFLTGSAPGHNASFIPPAPLVAAETRRLLNLRLDHARLVAPPPLALPEPTITPEERERGKARFAEILGHLPAADLERAEAEARTKERLRKSNERFMPDMSEEAISRRLGFTVGDPVGHEDAA